MPDPEPKGLPELIVWLAVIALLYFVVVPLLDDWGKPPPPQKIGQEANAERSFAGWAAGWADLN